MTRFSVIIPTLQKSCRLPALVSMYCAHFLVGEVIIVNNAIKPLRFDHEKVRVLQQTENIYVNPAWNLGASMARFPLLIISNDDISFDPCMIDVAASCLGTKVGIIGPHPASFNVPSKPRRVRLIHAYQRTPGYGTLMYMRAESYITIPADLLIWSGDNWLFYQQRLRNMYLKGFGIETEMQTTSALPEFHHQKMLDQRLYFAKYHNGAYRRRFPVGSALSRLNTLSTLTLQRVGRLVRGHARRLASIVHGTRR